MKLNENPLVERILYFSCPFVAFWFPWYWRNSNATRLRKIAGCSVWQATHGLGGKSMLVIKAIIWPLFALAGIGLTYLIYSKDVKKVFEHGHLSQLGDLFYFTFWIGILPYEYYSSRFYRFDVTDLKDHFLSSKETTLLNIAIGADPSLETIADKRLLELRCRELGLPTIQVIASYKDGNLQDRNDNRPFPATDLYLKPAKGTFGKGIERWDFDTDSKQWQFEEKILDEEALKKHFADASFDDTQLIQEAAQNHPSVEKYSKSGNLVTFRLMTLYGSLKEPEVMAAYIVMPAGSSAANHGSHGGIVAQMNLETKRFDFAIKRLPELMKLTHHSETGAPIYGEVFNEYSELEELAIQSHKCFPQALTVGWDLALTKHGPQIVEGNTHWGSMPGFFLGRTQYLEE